MTFRTAQQTLVLVTSFLLKHIPKTSFTSQGKLGVKIQTKAPKAEKLVAVGYKIQLTLTNTWDSSLSSI